MHSNRSVRRLNLTNNQLRGTALAGLLDGAALLTDLNCSWNSVDCASAMDVANSLSSNFFLHRLDLSYNAIGEAGGNSASRS
jgi:hypothetical protein